MKKILFCLMILSSLSVQTISADYVVIHRWIDEDGNEVPQN
jgi:hypothetical protein